MRMLRQRSILNRLSKNSVYTSNIHNKSQYEFTTTYNELKDPIN